MINSENYHALEAMLFTWQGTVDAIYIDPPYNTRDKDWKYNNDYVDSDDDYKHSKWLSFMERRLKLAQKLLNPANSVLIVTIDEKEYLRLGLLLQQMCKGFPVQMVTTVIAPSGQPRGNQMSRVEEYVFFVYFGAASASGGIDDMLSAKDETAQVVPPHDQPETSAVQWESLVRRGTSARRVDREKQFFPFFIDPQTKRIVSVGEPLLPPTADRSTVIAPDGTIAIWPLRSDGSEGRWRVSREGVETLLERGLVRVGRHNQERDQWAMNYVLRSDVKRLDAGEITIEGYSDQGAAILSAKLRAGSAGIVPKTVWNRDTHNAGNYGSAMLRALLPGRVFHFPKSLYAVEDALRFFVADKPDALVVDFFGGSGTTAHAVARLNKQDGGRRQSVVITNNEVSNEEATTMRRKGHRPGDPDWEARGICEYITKPRIEAAFTGRTPDGEPIKGTYHKGTDPFPLADGFKENVEFFVLTYQDPQLVELDMAFEAIAPLLWLRAGARGRRIEMPSATFDVADTYAVLFNVDAASAFATACASIPRLTSAFIVTDDEKQFQMVSGTLPPGVEPVRLYESYLRTFEINTGRE